MARKKAFEGFGGEGKPAGKLQWPGVTDEPYHGSDQDNAPMPKDSDWKNTTPTPYLSGGKRR